MTRFAKPSVIEHLTTCDFILCLSPLAPHPLALLAFRLTKLFSALANRFPHSPNGYLSSFASFSFDSASSEDIPDPFIKLAPPAFSFLSHHPDLVFTELNKIQSYIHLWASLVEGCRLHWTTRLMRTRSMAVLFTSKYSAHSSLPASELDCYKY